MRMCRPRFRPANPAGCLKCRPSLFGFLVRQNPAVTSRLWLLSDAFVSSRARSSMNGSTNSGGLLPGSPPGTNGPSHDSERHSTRLRNRTRSDQRDEGSDSIDRAVRRLASKMELHHHTTNHAAIARPALREPPLGCYSERWLRLSQSHFRRWLLQIF